MKPLAKHAPRLQTKTEATHGAHAFRLGGGGDRIFAYDPYVTSYRGTAGPGDHTVGKQGYGRADISRDHRLALSYTYELPKLENRLFIDIRQSALCSTRAEVELLGRAPGRLTGWRLENSKLWGGEQP